MEKVEVAVYLTYVTDAGPTFIDRALYLPKSWTSDPDPVRGHQSSRRHRVRNEVGTGEDRDRTCSRRWRRDRVGRRPRGLRRRPLAL
ncbi:hypothetical protein [Haloechinothrix aidingensis]|uniref:hypothetical protein n=1 Tax=Haloechinothrix aidingensis TaxID=2752311 RepID=UPI003CCDD663